MLSHTARNHPHEGATKRYRRVMRGASWLAAASLALLSCGDNDGPMPASFGLDVRPVNTTCSARQRPVFQSEVALERRWTGLTFEQPTYLTQAPGDDSRWYVVQREGKVRTFADSAISDAQVQDFVSISVNADGEGGLLGFAFHPSWPVTADAYLSYTRNTAVGDPDPPRCPGDV
jgi:hypothetical protein